MGIVLSAFRVGQYAIAVQVLERLFRGCSKQRNDMTAQSVLDCLRDILTRDLLAMNKRTCSQVIRLLWTCSLLMGNTVEAPKIPQSCFEKLPVEVRFELTMIKTCELPEKSSFEAQMSYYDEAEALASMEVGYPINKVFAVLMRCDAMVRYSRFEQLRSILVPNLRFVQTTLDSGGWMVWMMERMLAQLEYHDGNFKESIDSALRALTLINKESLLSKHSLSAVT